MKKLGLIFKEASENRIKQSIKESSAFFLIKYSGLSSPDMSILRQGLKSSRATMFVVKNSVARRALAGKSMESILKSIEGPCGFIFIKEEPVGVSKVLFSFGKEHEHLKLEGGIFGDKVLERNDIEAMSKLPSKEALRAQVVMALNSPISGLVIVLSATLKKFVYCLEQIKQKKTT